MIFVTVGSIFFDDLIRTIDVAIGEKRIPSDVIMQIANGTYLPKNGEYFRTAPGLQPYFDRADLVVGHGGVTTIEVLERGLRLVSVANPALSDNHQHEFLSALSHKGLTSYCANLAELPDYINRSLQSPKPALFDTNLFFKPVAADLDLL